MLRRLLHRLLYGGSTAFRYYERQILESVCAELALEDSKSLAEQINSVTLIQREHKNRMVLVFFAQKGALPRLSKVAVEYCLALVPFKAAQAANRCAVIAHNGLLSSIEFDKPPSLTRKDKVEILGVELSPKEYDCITKAIDCQEHGGK